MKILFLCTHNACRSILAEAIARKMGQGRWQVASAGSQPSGRVHPLTLHYLAEAGYSTDDLHSQGWDSLEAFQPDVLVTVCDQAAGEACPVWLGRATKVHWGLADPSRHAPGSPDADAAFRYTIRLLEDRFAALLKQDLDQLTPAQLQQLFTQTGALR